MRPLLIGYFQHHCVGKYFYIGLFKLGDESARVFGAGQLLAEEVQAEAVMYALLKYAAQIVIALQNQHLRARLVRLQRRRQTRRAAAYHDYIIVIHDP